MHSKDGNKNILPCRNVSSIMLFAPNQTIYSHGATQSHRTYKRPPHLSSTFTLKVLFLTVSCWKWQVLSCNQKTFWGRSTSSKNREKMLFCSKHCIWTNKSPPYKVLFQAPSSSTQSSTSINFNTDRLTNIDTFQIAKAQQTCICLQKCTIKFETCRVLKTPFSWTDRNINDLI